MTAFWIAWIGLSVAGGVLIARGLIRLFDWLDERGW